MNKEDDPVNNGLINRYKELYYLSKPLDDARTNLLLLHSNDYYKRLSSNFNDITPENEEEEEDSKDNSDRNYAERDFTRKSPLRLHHSSSSPSTHHSLSHPPPSQHHSNPIRKPHPSAGTERNRSDNTRRSQVENKHPALKNVWTDKQTESEIDEDE